MSSRFKTIAAAGVACALFVLPFQASAQTYDEDPQAQIDRLSDQLRKLTGQNEELQHQNQVLQQQLQQLQGAGGGRPPAPPAQTNTAAPPAYQGQAYQGQTYQGQSSSPPAQGGYQGQQGYQSRPYQDQSYQQSPPPAYQSQSPDDPDQAPINTPYGNAPVAPPSGGRRGDAFDPSQNPNAPGAPRPLGSMQGQSNYTQPGPPMDTTPRGSYAPQQGGYSEQQPGASASLTTLPPSATPKDEFDLGLGYIQRKDYALAEEAMRNFTAKYPSDRLVADAQYWLGESLFQRKQYRDAAEAFLTVTSKYDKSGKAPDALLRLGQSLAELKQKDAACASFGEVLRKYPKASSGVKQGVAREQKRAGC